MDPLEAFEFLASLIGGFAIGHWIALRILKGLGR